MTGRLARVALLVLGALSLACASPIGVDRVSPESVQRKLTGSVLSNGKLSEGSRNLLRRANLLAVFQADPELALAAAHEVIVERSGWRALPTGALVAVAEASFLHATRSGDRSYFLLAAVYAWAALFGGEGPLDPLDPQVRLAANLYNRGLTLVSLPPQAKGEFRLEPGLHELPIGQLVLRVDPDELRWGDRRLEHFTPVADLRIRGLNNRYRRFGIGAPAAASTTLPDPESARAASAIVFDRIRVPVSVVVVIDDVMAGLASGLVRAHVEIHTGEGDSAVEIAGRSYPVDLEPSASLALMLAEVAPWRGEIRALFEGDRERKHDGLALLSLHRPGRIPVIFVHGTASNPATWANLLNDLMADPEIADRYEFWLFGYNSGAPILYSASLLRQAIAEAVQELDPEGTDPALRRAVVIGHSQGGLLTKLLAVDAGSLFWNQISDRPLGELNLREETRSLIEDAVFVRPSPFVERVVFIATPHRGSFLLTYGITNLFRNMVKAPSSVVRAAADLVSQDSEAAAVETIDDVEGALSQMNPNSRLLATLVELPLAPGIRGHSIIAVKEFAAKEDATDGVVEYQSAQLPGVDSEVLVESGHSCLDNAFVAGEVSRILQMHLRSAGPGPDA